MESSSSYVSTRQAAEILGVHESSVKRWCNAEEIACDFTPGGHRRFQVDHLVAFGRAQMLTSPVLALHPYEQDVWSAMEQARTESAYGPLVDILFAWLSDHQAERAAQLLISLYQSGFTLPTLFDTLVAPCMYRIGKRWEHGTLDIGDEHRMTQLVKDALGTLRHFLHEEAARPEAGQNGAEHPVAILGCGRNEEHELGALMTRLVLEGEGWDVLYLGPNVPTEEFARQQQKHGAPLVCVSLSPMRGPADAWGLIRLLAGLYRPTSPYRFAIGGSRPLLQHDTGDLPFEDVHDFIKLETFVDWL